MKTFKIAFGVFGLMFATAFGAYRYATTASVTSTTQLAAQPSVVVAKAIAGAPAAGSSHVGEDRLHLRAIREDRADALNLRSTDHAPAIADENVGKRISQTTKGRASWAGGFLSPLPTTNQPIVGDQTVTTEHFQTPSGITIDASGNLYVTDSARNVVRKISTTLTVSTVAGTSGSPGNANGRGAVARFNAPKGVSYYSGSLYVADSGNGAIRKVSTNDGTVSTLAPVVGEAVAVDSGGNAYVTDYESDQVRKVTASGTVSSFAGVSSASQSTGIIDAYVVSGDIDPVDPRWRNWRSTDKGDQSAGLAPVAITEGLYGVRLELTEDTPATIAYTATDFPIPGTWGSHELPYTATYGNSWIFPLMAFHRGAEPMDRAADTFRDSQLWGVGGGGVWFKLSANVVMFATIGDSPEVFGSIYRITTLTFTSVNSGTFSTQYGLYPVSTAFVPGVSNLSKVLATTSGRFVLNRTTQIVPTQNDFGLYSGFWIE